MNTATRPPLGEHVSLSHGGGGRDMHRLLRQLVLPILCGTDQHGDDSAIIDLHSLPANDDRLAFTTDAYTVQPLFFNGGNIGTLAVNGTVNDLAMSGARPHYLSCSLMIEEGFAVSELHAILQSMRTSADAAGVSIITGDTKVVHRGAVDGLFINTSGIGSIPSYRRPSASSIRAGDRILLNGGIGEHGVAVLVAREDLKLSVPVQSDCQPLHTLVDAMFAACADIRFLRDATRGGVATVLNEFASAAALGIDIDEAAIPIGTAVRSCCEILGLDPLHLANEGRLLAVVPPEQANAVVAAMRNTEAGRDSAIIGTVTERHPGKVSLNNTFGGSRLIDLPAGELLPRIC